MVGDAMIAPKKPTTLSGDSFGEANNEHAKVVKSAQYYFLTFFTALPSS